jgi:hypothetical protein
MPRFKFKWKSPELPDGVEEEHDESQVVDQKSAEEQVTAWISEFNDGELAILPDGRSIRTVVAVEFLGPDTTKRYAHVSWTAHDVQSLAPKLTEEQAEEWLQQNERHIRDCIISHGWCVIDSLLRDDGIDRSEPQETE